MSQPVVVPSVGESITEGVLARWFVEDGALVAAEQPLFELETDKITLEVPSATPGILRISVAGGSDVTVGQVVGQLEPAPASTAASPPAPSAPQAAPPATRGLSPVVRRLVKEHDIDPTRLSGTGPSGRVTRTDVEAHLAERAPAEAPPPTVEPPPPAAATEAARRETRARLPTLRRRLAERLVQVQQSAAILTTFNEVDLTAVRALRSTHKEAFEAAHGVRLGFMSFFVKAAVEALRAVPALNARIEGDELVQLHYYDIGVAVGTPQGLVVPVVRAADQLDFAGIEQAISALAERARARRLTLDDLTGGCFTISNGGVYGSLLSTPILNPPQSGILGMHTIKRRPIAVGDSIEIRPMMYLALSYDHRIVDGAQAVTFLKRIVDVLEQPERLLLGV